MPNRQHPQLPQEPRSRGRRKQMQTSPDDDEAQRADQTHLDPASIEDQESAQDQNDEDGIARGSERRDDPGI
jgi:hypothetical protein